MSYIPGIIKSGGHCYDGPGWHLCPFWERRKKISDNFCKLFGGSQGVRKNASASLVICDKMYGKDYEGKV